MDNYNKEYDCFEVMTIYESSRQKFVLPATFLSLSYYIKSNLGYAQMGLCMVVM